MVTLTDQILLTLLVGIIDSLKTHSSSCCKHTLSSITDVFGSNFKFLKDDMVGNIKVSYHQENMSLQ